MEPKLETSPGIQVSHGRHFPAAGVGRCLMAIGRLAIHLTSRPSSNYSATSARNAGNPPYETTVTFRHYLSGFPRVRPAHQQFKRKILGKGKWPMHVLPSSFLTSLDRWVCSAFPTKEKRYRSFVPSGSGIELGWLRPTRRHLPVDLMSVMHGILIRGFSQSDHASYTWCQSLETSAHPLRRRWAGYWILNI